MEHHPLAGEWQAAWVDSRGVIPADDLALLADSARTFPITIPGSISRALCQAGKLAQLDAVCMEKHAWILRREFVIPDIAADEPAYLFFEELHGQARVIVNGAAVGKHASPYCPAIFDITGLLHPGGNAVTVVMVGSPISRKTDILPDWDWNSPLMRLGVPGNVEVITDAGLWIKQVEVCTEITDNLGWGRIRLHPMFQVTGDRELNLTLQLMSWDELCAETQVTLLPGAGDADVTLDIAKPQLWWPRGCGKGFLYPLYLSVLAGDRPVAHWEGRTGLRHVEEGWLPSLEADGEFLVRINHCPVACNGAGWSPPLLNPFEVERENIARLVEQAEEEAINLLRIRGGSIWANHTLLNLCDERGMLVWQDASSDLSIAAPGDPAGMAHEAAWGSRELRTHPSLLSCYGWQWLDQGNLAA